MKFSFWFKYLKSTVLKKGVVFFGICILLSALIATVVSVPSFSKNVNAQESVNVIMIMYHSVLKSSSRQGTYVITPNDFESDLKYLTDKGYHTIFIGDLINYVYNGVALPEKPVILTFDDGYYNNYLYAFPLLKQYNCKMVLSPIAKCSEMYSDTNEENATYSHVTWDEIKEMSASGLVEIANHSYDLHTNSSRKGACEKKGENYEQYKSVLAKDLGKAQDLLTQKVGITPQVFTYPFGAYCGDSEEIIKELGFKATVVCEEKINCITQGDIDCLYSLGRYLRPGNTSANTFFSSKKIL